MRTKRKYKRKYVKGKYYSAHRCIMEAHLRRKLLKSEVIHHINNDPLDNRIENLQVMTYKEHANHHNRVNFGDCIIQDCNNKAIVKKLCDKHRTRLARHGDTSTLLKVQSYGGKNFQCKIYGCPYKNKPNFGYCWRHYVKLKRHGDPKYKKPNKSCLHIGCNRKHLSKNYCSPHYKQIFVRKYSFTRDIKRKTTLPC